MNLLPIFLKLDSRRGLVVGAGAVALEKIGSLLPTGLRLRVIAPEGNQAIRQLAAEGRIEFVQRPFEIADLDGNFVVIAATNSPDVNAAVYQGAVERGILANSVDDPPHCDFYFGSVVRRGALQIAISTAGESPAVAQQLRREIDEQLPQDLGPWLEEVGKLRREILAMHPPGEERKLLLHQLAHRSACEAAFCPARQSVAVDKKGKVYLVGAGPGDPELLTVKALRLLQSTDVVLHDDLVPPTILELAAPSAEVVNVGKRYGVKKISQEAINARMIELARSGRSVVRLKSGDPLLFGRAAEEMAALAEAGVPFEIVPGITAAFAAAAALGCSLTSRASASSIIIATGHHAKTADPTREKQPTRVVYMPGRDLKSLAHEWLAEGLPANLPCAIVSCAGQLEEAVHRTTLGALGDAPSLSAPSLLIAGWALHESVTPIR